MENERVLVRIALWMTANTPFAPGVAERRLLAKYLDGVLTLDQILGLLEDRVQTAQALDGIAQLTADTSA